MADLNKVLLIGRLGAKPEMKSTPGGGAVARMRLATGRVRKGEGDNEDVHETDWHDVVAFGKLAQTCGSFLEKGRQVFVEGRISSDVWTDKDGKRRLSREVIARRVDFLDRKPLEQAQAAAG